MAKSFAYTSQWGGHSDKVTAKQIESCRRDEFNGQPTGQSFYSTHKPGSRKAVKHVMKGGTSFFAYINSSGGGGGEGGESLNHQLFKEALLTIETTRLSLIFNAGTRAQRQENIVVKIIQAESEKRVIIPPQGHRSVDVYLKFETDSHIGRKWEGELYLEIHSTHAVDAEKQTELRALSVPVVEVDIPDVFIYKFSDENTTDEREAAHKVFVRNVLEGVNGFLKCVVLSNPSSKAYLEEQVVLQQRSLSELRKRNEESEGLRADLSKRLDAVGDAFKSSEANGVNLKFQLSALGNAHETASRQLVIVRNSLVEAEVANLKLKSDIENLSDALEKKDGEHRKILEALTRLKAAYGALNTDKQKYVIRSRRLGVALASLFIAGGGAVWLVSSSVKMSSVFKPLHAILTWF
ncbi:hypothetical protein [Pseudomonas sp. GW456-12-1-14-TSB6]|uniref:hypothetical protein n=1 Tax=Pseudomonas sp. GW456-12-1-14-TSB6 TaxID=2751350 RepID=UPI0011AFC0A0|nr:hypothetical protein [Pseudomonas sp. GW456-12-1-14-TSB6]